MATPAPLREIRRPASRDTIRRMSGLSSVVVGDAAIALRCAEILQARGHPVLGVVTGDGRIAGWCAGRRIPCRFEGPRTPLTPAAVRGLVGGEDFDLLFSLHNLRIFPAELLALPRRMAINYHDALLPRYAGLHATTWALFQGEAEHGITWHRMTPEVDAGEILVQRRFPVPEDAGAWALNVACAEAAIDSFPELLAGLESGRLAPRPQETAGRSGFPGWRKPAPGCVIPWDLPAERISAFVRSLDFGAADNPLGTPKLLAPGGVLLVPCLEALERRSGQPASTVLAVGPEGIEVATATRDVRIPWDAAAEDLGLAPGVRLAVAAPDAERFAARERSLRRHEDVWIEALADLAPLAPPGFSPADEGEIEDSRETQVSEEVLTRLAELGPEIDGLLGALLAWLALEVGEPFDVAFGEPGLRREIVESGWGGLLAARPPLRVQMGRDASLRTFLERAEPGSRPSTRTGHLSARSDRSRAPSPLAAARGAGGRGRPSGGRRREAWARSGHGPRGGDLRGGRTADLEIQGI
jgi:polyketide synthase PksN